MSARRTSSTTSLSKYARVQGTEEGLANRSLEFCNAFWGIADGGYDVLLTRIRGAARTTEELRAFWKERASIEDDYAKRMSKLAKQPLGRDEIGELRNAIDTIRLETDKQAVAHAGLAQLMRKDLEQPVMELLSKQAQFKKLSQTPIEKSYKAKQTQESYVKKARQKYEDDCVRINSYTAQSTLVQGKDLEKIQLKLEKARQTVQANEREFSQFARALADTTSRWEKEWKVFCDGCQDFEEERIEFIKDNMWGYANAVSTVCVSDDESCEMIRVALEQVEPDKDVENFVRDYSTGSQIPDPPAFVDYNTLEAGQRPSRPSWRPANFARSSNRAVSIPLRQPPAEEETVTPGHAGIGAGGGRSENGPSGRPVSVAASRAVSATVNGIPSTGSISSARSGQHGPTPAPSSGAVSSQQGAPKQGPNPTGFQSEHGAPKQGPVPTASQTGPSQPTNMPQALPGLAKGSSPSYRAPQTQDPHAEPIDPRAETLLKVGTNAYPVNLGEDPQQSRTGPNGSVGGNVGEQDDPLAKQAKALRDASRGSVRRGNAPIRQSPGGISPSAPVASGSGSSLSHTGGKTYQAQADSVAGGSSPSAARTASPNPPTANFMVPPGNRPTSPLPVEEVVSTYQQHFPGERRSLSISRPNSVNGGKSGEQNIVSASGSGAIARAVSPAREGRPGIGAHGGSRSPSPQPISRSASPAPTPTQSQQPQQLSYHAPSMQQGPLRATSNLGIAIDASGRVAQDVLAERMYGHQGQAVQQETQRRTSYYGGPPPPGPPPGPPPQQAYDAFGAPRDLGKMYGQPPSQRQYPQAPPQAPPPQVPPPQVPPPPPQQAPTRPAAQFYNPHAPQNPPRQGTAPLYDPYQPGVQPSAGVPQGRPQYPSQQPLQQQAQFGYPDQPQPARQVYSGYNQHVPPPPPNGYQQSGRPSDVGPPHAYGQQPPQGYRVPSPVPMKRSPSPAPPVIPPTGQYTEDGQGVLFYVKALYDYQATIEEEFDFQAGDVIAVTATPEDGWWSGMLLDEMRRVPGKTIFPSNFVSLF
ncbi:hypothetical protein JB92DRAFT_3061254 [Gautieria morchelliformis]|nr:hypothetical protein JB92DRAFT_3061254 [Gautieria morchelliformis]